MVPYFKYIRNNKCYKKEVEMPGLRFILQNLCGQRWFEIFIVNYVWIKKVTLHNDNWSLWWIRITKVSVMLCNGCRSSVTVVLCTTVMFHYFSSNWNFPFMVAPGISDLLLAQAVPVASTYLTTFWRQEFSLRSPSLWNNALTSKSEL